MTINELLREGRAIWGDDRLSLEEIVVRQAVVSGDIARWARDRAEGHAVDESELQKELGNSIFSMIRWCDDLGYDPEACILLAQKAQRAYRQSRAEVSDAA